MTLMNDQIAPFSGSVPENYDRYLGPMFFHPYATDLVSRINVHNDAAVLEIACGTGIVTRLLRDRLPASVTLTATDLNEKMMSLAQKKFKPEDAVEWKQADASALPFANESFDAVVCQFGLMFVPDKAAALCEAARVLKSKGVFVFNVWDSLHENEFARIAHETVGNLFENDPPAFYQLPFGYYDREAIQSALRELGFAR